MRRLISATPFLALLFASHAHALVWPDVPERIERQLSSPDAGARRNAARDLATLGAGRGTPLVVKALKDADVEVRLAAAQSAIRLKVTEATELAVNNWLGERDNRLRVAACDIAGAMPSAHAVQLIGRALGDPDPQVRTACADALGASGSVEAVAPLSGKLDDPTPGVRSEVARALAKLGDPRAVVPLVGKVQDSVPEVRQTVVRALGELGDPRATQALLLALRDNVPEVKTEALAALGRLHAPEAASAIAPLALERNPQVKQAALVALGRIGTPEAVRALIRALGTQDDANGTLERTPVRDALIAAGPVAVTELTALLDRPISSSVATSAAWVLGELKATASAPAIVNALRKGVLQPNAALRALAGAGTAEQVPVVLEFVADPSPTVREEALKAATALLDPSKPDGRAVEPLAALLRNPRASTTERAAVATLLGRTGAPRAAAELAGLVGSKDIPLRLAAIDALGALGAAQSGAADDALVPLLTDTESSVRLHSAIALAACGGTKARTKLFEKLDSDEELDRYALFTALGGILERLGDEKSAARLFRELGVAAGPERDAVLEAAGRAKAPGVIQSLQDTAKSGDADDRRMVAAVLTAHKGEAPAIALARSLTADSDVNVRAQAAFTLGTIADAGAAADLVKLARSGDLDVAANAAAGLARIAQTAGASIASSVCPLLADGRATVRANALVALANGKVRCSDGKTERKLLVDDPSDLVRAGAARALAATPLPDDRQPIEHCISQDRSAEVAQLCRPRTVPVTVRLPRAVTIYIVTETGSRAKPRAPFLLEYGGGVLRAGVADRRGATFDAASPAGDLVLRRPPSR